MVPDHFFCCCLFNSGIISLVIFVQAADVSCLIVYFEFWPVSAL